MRPSFLLSALILATVHSCSRSVRSCNTFSSSAGGGASSALELSLLFTFSSAELELGLELLGWGILALKLEGFLFDDARITLGIKIAPAIPSPAKTTNTTARIPRTQGHVLRLL